ncbi:MAG: hypothetical protein ACLRXH_06000 [Monoglobus pectinilyticus]|uniref:hypothetical protein n=1 Tax=Monoglobus pectinilyticus TaxID=1981510 RepID=UPI0039A08B76
MPAVSVVLGIRASIFCAQYIIGMPASWISPIRLPRPLHHWKGKLKCWAIGSIDGTEIQPGTGFIFTENTTVYAV